MGKMIYYNGVSGLSVPKSDVFERSSSGRSNGGEDFQKQVATEIAKIRRNEFARDRLEDFDEVDLHDETIREPDDSQLLTVEPPVTLSKITSQLTAVERLWLARIVKAHGKELILARWPAYEIHINYVRCLR